MRLRASDLRSYSYHILKDCGVRWSSAELPAAICRGENAPPQLALGQAQHDEFEPAAAHTPCRQLSRLAINRGRYSPCSAPGGLGKRKEAGDAGEPVQPGVAEDMAADASACLFSEQEKETPGNESVSENKGQRSREAEVEGANEEKAESGKKVVNSVHFGYCTAAMTGSLPYYVILIIVMRPGCKCVPATVAFQEKKYRCGVRISYVCVLRVF